MSAEALDKAIVRAVPPLQLVDGRHRHWREWLLIATCALFTMLFVHGLSKRIDPLLFASYAPNVWFQADLQRSLANMVDVDSHHYRTKVHPIASLVTLPVTKLIGTVFPGTGPQTAVRLMALAAGFWIAGLYWLCRRLGATITAALALALLAACSAAFIFWFTVPETYGLGSLCILLALLAATRAPARQGAMLSYVGVSAITLSITVTNWMAGIALAFSALPVRKALRVTLLAFLLVAVLALLQKRWLESAGLFFLGSAEEALFINVAEAGLWWNKMAVMLLHAFAMPQITVTPPLAASDWPLLSVQLASPGSGSGFGLAALALWIVLLAMGMQGGWLAWRSGRQRVFIAVLGLSLAGQIFLHLLYGEETFLYALHWLPLLVGLVALGLYSPRARFLPWLALVAASCALANNLAMFSSATAQLNASPNQREQVERAMAARPGDFWPRGKGHVVLGMAGSALAAKAYHEPGAAFSPAPGSFGVSVWVLDAEGKVVATSDTLPMAQIGQRFEFSAESATPAVHTETPYFTALWTHGAAGSELILTPVQIEPPLQLRLMLRSVGPAGGPLHSATSRDGGLLLNGFWRVDAKDAQGEAATWRIGREEVWGLAPLHAMAVAASSTSGWLYAALPLQAVSATRVTITPAKLPTASPLFSKQPLAWKPLVPDARFTAAAHAQQAHLLMGLTEGQTRPGEPVNYSFPWMRDAAYMLVALTRSGQLEVARSLAPELAERDFLGGFGAEADGPGLALWALGELSAVLADPAFDAWLWPHAQRKLRWIESCLEATGPVMAHSQNDIDAALPMGAPLYRLCEPAWQGLMIGRMDNHYPVLFVNATAHAGLRQAAALARRLGYGAAAAAHTERAGKVQRAWQRQVIQPSPPPFEHATSLAGRVFIKLRMMVSAQARRDLVIAHNWRASNRNERSYAAAQWPAWTLGDDAETKRLYRAALAQRWSQLRDAEGGYKERPLWTYFDFAEAHQWLLLGESERAWQTLEWFFANQSSPGLFSWWEGNGEENTSRLWATLRGWVKPDSVTPHYWSAAEALALQLDMLTYVDESKPSRPIVIGAGVPADWLRQPVDSGIIHTSYGPVRWQWHSGEVVLQSRDPAVLVEFGPALRAAGARLRRK